MTPENIIQLISLLLGGGGLIALFLITERKTKAQMENTAQPIAGDPIGVAEVDEVWVQYHLVKVKSSVKHNPGKAVGAPFLVS